MLYQRKLFQRLIKEINKPTTTVLCGMRGAGKTTLAKMVFNSIPSRNKAFFDMGDFSDNILFRDHDHALIWEEIKKKGIDQKNKAYIFIDEIHRMPDLMLSIRNLSQRYKLKLFLISACDIYYEDHFPQESSIDKTIFILRTLDFEEFLSFKNSYKEERKDFKDKEKNNDFSDYKINKSFYDEYIEYGGLPAVVLERDEKEKIRIIKDIINTYIHHDLQSIKKLKNMDKITLLIKVFCENIGKRMDISALSLKIGVSRMTFYAYVKLLESTFLLDLVKPYSSNKAKEFTGTKKIFICDNGILNVLTKINLRESLLNAIYNDLKIYGIIRYYKKRTGREIDFIIMGQMIALNIIIHPSIKDFEQLKKTAAYLRLKRFYVVSYDFFAHKGFLPVTEL